jgi:hypothetical protein
MYFNPEGQLHTSTSKSSRKQWPKYVNSRGMSRAQDNRNMALFLTLGGARFEAAVRENKQSYL